ncbi:MAG: hypothetical protein EPO40_31225 [Myxococcaceae bacterium]|nr:MAG: hypothetical protein EPO40_31225 [Myxococcaceae bacterium]
MSEPRRWRHDDGGASPEVRDLLAAGRAPRGMSPAERDRATRQAARIAAAPVGWFAWSSASKALAASLATVGLVVAARVVVPHTTAHRGVSRPAAAVRTSGRAPEAAPSSVSVPPVVTSAPTAATVASTPVRTAAPRTAPMPRPHRLPPTAPSSGSVPVLAPVSSGAVVAPAMAPRRDESLAAEAALLVRAQRSLESDPEASLGLLDTHAGFAHPRLAEERELLAVLALQRLGRAEAMRVRGEAMLARWPTGAAAQRVRRLLGPMPSP